MGKKSLRSPLAPRREKKRYKESQRELAPASRTLKVHLHKLLQGVQFKKKAPRAIRALKALAKRTMFTNDVRVDPELNRKIWSNGIRNLPVRITICLERKKNEEEEEGQEKMYTVVKYVQQEEK